MERKTVHGGDVTKAASHGFVSEVFEGSIGHVELNTLGQGVGCDKNFLATGADDGAVVADAFDGAFVLWFEILFDALNKCELAKARKFGAAFVGIF